MPVIRDRTQQEAPVQSKITVPSDFPDIPQEIKDRFPSAADWQRRLDDFWTRTNEAFQDAQSQISKSVNSLSIQSVQSFRIYNLQSEGLPIFDVDGTGIRLGDVLVVNTAGKTLHVGVGNFADDDTPIYMDTLGKFSLGSSFAYDPTVGVGISIVITGGSIDNTPIGVTVPAEGHFTTLSATGNVLINTTSGVLQFGGSTNIFPALRYEAADTIGVILADASGYAKIKALGFIGGTGSFTTVTATGAVTVVNAAANAALILDGSTTNNLGAFIRFNRGGVVKWQIGNSSGILGGASDALVVYDQIAGAVMATFTTGAGLAITGLLTTTGNVTFGPGTAGTNKLTLTLNGGSGAAGGPYVTFQRNSVDIAYFGANEAIYNPALNLDNIMLSCLGDFLIGAASAGPWGTGFVAKFTSGGLVMSLGADIQLGNAYVAGAVVPTGTLTLRDSSGTVYRVPCLI